MTPGDVFHRLWHRNQSASSARQAGERAERGTHPDAGRPSTHRLRLQRGLPAKVHAVTTADARPEAGLAGTSDPFIGDALRAHPLSLDTGAWAKPRRPA